MLDSCVSLSTASHINNDELAHRATVDIMAVATKVLEKLMMEEKLKE